MKANVYGSGRVPEAPRRNAVERPASAKTSPRGKIGSARWLIVGLLLLTAIPLAGGAVRLVGLAGGAAITPDNARFFAAPLPIVLHILSAAVFGILGPFQFSTALRRRRPGWHRMSGRLVVGAGLVVGLSALWMTLFSARAPGSGDLLVAFRLLFGSAMLGSIVFAFAAIRRRDVQQHRAWMLRAYAIALGAGTQALTQGVGAAIVGQPSELGVALLMAAGWVINLAIAEWVIRRRRRPVHLSASGRPSDGQVELAPGV